MREFNKMFWNHVDIICPYLSFIMLNYFCHNKLKNAKNTYLGHFTKCVRSLFGWMSCPMPKDLGLFSKSGLDTRLTSGFFTAKGAAATFFPFLFCWKRRRIDKLMAARWIMNTLHLQWIDDRNNRTLEQKTYLLVNHFDRDLGDSLGFAKTCGNFTSDLGKSQTGKGRSVLILISSQLWQPRAAKWFHLIHNATHMMFSELQMFT